MEAFGSRAALTAGRSAADVNHRAGLLLLVVTVVPTLAILGVTARHDAVGTAAQLAGAVAGTCVLIAAVLFYLEWRVNPVTRHGWLAGGTIVLAHQLLVAAVLAFANAGEVGSGWPLAFDTLTTLTALAVLAMAAREDPPRCPDPLVLGLGIGTLITVPRLVLPTTTPDLALPMVPLAAVIVLGHLALAAIAVRFSYLPGWASRRLATTLVLLAATNIALPAVTGGSAVDLLTSTLCAGAAVVWASATFAMLRHTVERRHRRTAHLEDTLLVAEHDRRSTREQLHELRSTVCGLASASRLVADPRVADDARRRLQRSMRAELERMERLLSPETAPEPASGAEVEGVDVDVDESIETVLALHRARGRVVEWTPTGARIVGRQDALKEAVNILLDNAAVHGSATGTRVDVRHTGDMVQISVTDDGPGVPATLRDSIFEWGRSRPGSPGQGIGLNVAHRLVTEQGGSLSLSSQSTHGSSFVIRLPRVRQSQENLSVRTEHHQG